MSTAKRRPPAGAAVLRGEITAAIRQAAMRELAAVGYGRLSIESIARRANVGKTAIYRRWASKLALVLDVISEVASQRLPLPDTGSLHGDIEALLHALARALQHPLAGQIVPDLLAEAARNPAIAETLQLALRTHQRAVGERLVGRAIRRGELPSGIEPEAACELIVGPLYWRLAIARSPLAAADVPRLANAIVAALQSGGTGAAERHIPTGRASGGSDPTASSLATPAGGSKPG